jgi:hypothetical protein
MDKSFAERMKAYPELKKHIDQMLDVIENVGGKANKANDAEIQVIDNMRKIGATALQEWAAQREKTASAQWVEEHPTSIKHGKKSPLGNHYWTPRSDSAAFFT